MQTNSEVSGVDKGLIKIFLKMSVEERLMANNKAAQAIQELRNAYREQERNKTRSNSNT